VSNTFQETAMQFFSLYTPAAQVSGPPDAIHIANMTKLTEDMFKAGVLVSMGGIMSRNTGMKVSLKNGQFSVEHGPVPNSSLMPAAGFALLRANSREELVKHLKTFLEIAGDGTTEIIQVMDGPPPKA
jgi:hypothetical protein